MTLVLIFAFVGLLLIYLEFFLPGLLMAIFGGIFLSASFIFFILQGLGILSIIGYFILLVLLVLAISKLALWQMKKRHRKANFYLEKDQEGYQAATFNKELIGKPAIAITDLKPSGHILVDKERSQAISESGYISKDAHVLITGGRGAYYIVKLKKE